eukprot:gene13422-13536_t
MARFLYRVLMFGLIVVFSGPLAAETTPKAMLTEIYKTYIGKGAHGFDWNTASLTRKTFSASTAKLMMDDAKAHAGEVGSLDFDPFVAAQDFEISKVDIDAALIDESHAQAIASFKNLGVVNKVKFSLVKEASGWRIDDITWLNLKPVETLKSLYKNN